MSDEKLLKLQDIHVHYGGVKALDGASVVIDENEIVALMGPNGAGKSTLIKALFGIAPIESGKVFWHEKEISPIAREMIDRGVSYVPQGRRVFSSLSVLENLEIGAYTVSSKNEVKERISEVLDLFPALKLKINDKSGHLSGGQQQMLAIARGLMTDPRLLLLDEPSIGLAPKIVKEVFEKIRHINEVRKTSIVIVEHNLKSVNEIAHRTYVLDKGKVVAEGKPKELVDSGILEKVFLGLV
ncbi:MAG: branched-chain amino acid transport system ATP-binding protein [Patescibacteria group bacterium]|jgi:branched-chain amino acid transport system ATP-binding protein|nr:branched-chain amino acid transport system ATP-binding protein [Patescibacteria group bacterium]